MSTPRNRYNAYRIAGGVNNGLWRGWMVHGGQPRNVIETPDLYATKSEALAAIKGQHP